MSATEERPQVVLVLGKAGVGKSTFIKTATGLDVEVGNNLSTCTHEVQIYPVPDTKIFLIDTPGFDDPERSDADILQSIASCLADLHEGLIFDGKEVDLHGVVYVHTIQDVRMAGTMLQNLKVFRNLVGSKHMDHCVLLTTKWDLERKDKAEERESELVNKPQFWKEDIEAGAKAMRFENTRQSALEILTSATEKGSFVSQLSQEYIVEGRPLIDTTSGRAINKDLAAIRAQHTKELASIRSELAQASKVQNAEMAAQVRKHRVRTESSIRQLDGDAKVLSNTREGEQKRLDELEVASDSSTLFETGPKVPSKRLSKRQKRALRWFIRFAGFGAAIAITAVTHGAMAPVGVALVIGIETILQAMKANQREDEKFALENERSRK